MPKRNALSELLLKEAIDAGITDPRELANIMGNAAVETGHFILNRSQLLRERIKGCASAGFLKSRP